MPQLVTAPIPATQIKVNDAIDFDNEGAVTTTVTAVDVKRAYVYVTAGDGMVHRLGRDQLVTRHRYEPTAEETAAEERAYANDVIERSIKKAPQALADARDAMVKALDQNVDLHWSSYPKFIAAQTEHALWMRVYGLESHEDVKDFVEALKITVKDETREMMEYSNFASRSTNVMANAIEDVVRQTKAQWMRHNRWYLLGGE